CFSQVCPHGLLHREKCVARYLPHRDAGTGKIQLTRNIYRRRLYGLERLPMSNGDNSGARHPGLASLFRYPLMAAIAERRTRRISRGTSVSAAGLSHTSNNPPAPRAPLEEA